MMNNYQGRVVVDGENLKRSDVVKVARGINGLYPEVVLSQEVIDKIKKVRKYVDEKWLSGKAPTIYGFNTGVGVLKDQQIDEQENDEFQNLLIESHAAGIGDDAPVEVVRATILLRVNALARGVSGIRLEVVERLLEMLNCGVYPVIPEQGSVGASGDLAPMAHLVAVLTGHEDAEAIYQGEKMKAAEALIKAGMEDSFQMKAKDVLAMINGCTFTLAYAVLALEDSRSIMENANLASAMSIESMRGEMAAFDDRIQLARNQKGQRKSAEEIRNILNDSEWTTEKGRKIKLINEIREGDFKPRVQDAYTLRCIPQVHGPGYDVLDFVEELIEREINAAIDNPLIFEDGNGGYEALSGGNFHGQYLAYAMDFLAIVIHEVGDISERRTSRMMDSKLSYGLPANLVGDRVGLNTGFILVQTAASALVSENKLKCFPASADSIPTKNNQEDHVSMSTYAARKAREVVDNVNKIIAIEFLIAAQAISLIKGQMGTLKMAEKTNKTYELIRQKIPATVKDRFMHKQMQTIYEMVINNELI
jgi:histidine ammonia-lyase